MPRHAAGAHTKHRLQYHLVWIPKYRKRVLTGPLAAALRGLLEETARAKQWRIDELNVQSDHVHMLIRLSPDVSVARAVQLLKGGSSFRLRREFPELEKALRGASLWADGYFAESTGVVEEETIRRYIREQPETDQSLP